MNDLTQTALDVASGIDEGLHNFGIRTLHNLSKSEFRRGMMELFSLGYIVRVAEGKKEYCKFTTEGRKWYNTVKDD